MTTRVRVLHIVVLTVLAIVTRAIHLGYRAPAGSTDGIIKYVALGLLFAVVAAVLGSPPHTNRISVAFVSALNVALVGLGGAATSQVFIPGSLPRFSLLAMAAASFAWLFVTGIAGAVGRKRAGEIDRIFAVVSPEDANELIRESSAPSLRKRFAIVETITDDALHHEVAERARHMRTTVLVLGRQAIIEPGIIEQAANLHQQGVRVRSLDKFYDERLGKLPISSLDSFALMGDIESLHGAYRPLKRAIDLGLSILGGVFLLVLLPFILLGNLIGNRGPLFFRQERAGLFGRPFSIVKLRTMSPGAVDVSGWTSNNDPRITGFGKLLRRTHIDELPQVLNIFLGELSVVGPRPEQIAYVRQLEKTLPFYAARHLVHPGLTGWAQVKYPYAASEEDAFIKLQYDLHYVRNESFATDLRIIGLTVKHLLIDGGR